MSNRGDYKSTWNNLSRTEDEAKLHVSGHLDEAQNRFLAEATYQSLQATVGVEPEDEVLEIGCGVGRVGRALAPRVRHWTGADVSPSMLQHSATRLAEFSNVSFVETSGYDLQAVKDKSQDMVYCTVVFMHLDEWDRYNYVLEARRVLRPGGRVYVDNFNLLSEAGWAIFEQHRSMPPAQRPSHISKSSTPQELLTYLRRANFRSVTVDEEGAWVRAWGRK